ncbi:MAG TPA: hypothetical protein VLM05_11095 [Mycobacteriales bacterium]|nr:hypothetical protein [Mycobacteriales bacterium]
MRRVLLLLAAVVLGALLLPANPAAAAGPRCHQEAVKNPDGSITYHLVCTTVVPGDPGSGGGEEDCGQDTANLPYEGAPFCMGGIPCQYTDNIVPLAPPATPAPEGQKWQARYCTDGTKVLVLTGGNQPRPLIVQAQEAFGNLAPPAATVRHSPDTRGIVKLETWFWLDGASFGELHGTSAEGLVAVAVPDSTVWTTGDGGSVTCAGPGQAYSAGATSDCTHTYTRASARYDGTVARNWVVHYEQGGAPITIPGAPVALNANTAWALAVAEAQVLTGGR